MDKKKTLILSILGVLILVVAVVGISYAMYTFTGTGSRENTITTGTISVSYAEQNTIVLENVYPESDARGTSAANPETLDFTVNATISGGNTLIRYEVQLVPTVDNVEGGLRDSHIDFNLQKKTGDGDFAYLIGSATTGVALSTLAGTNGSIIQSNGYVVASGSFSGTQTDTYSLKAWVNDTYNLPTTGTGTCDITLATVPTEEGACLAIYGLWNGSTCSLSDAYSCVHANGTWTDTVTGVHSNSTTASTFSFKVNVQAIG